MRFNSRSREGSDLSLIQIIQLSVCFNSRSREGSDEAIDWLKTVQAGFQFTLP